VSYHARVVPAIVVAAIVPPPRNERASGARIAAVTARLDHAAFVFVAGLVAYGIAKVHIDPPDMVAVAVQCGMDHRLHLSGRLLAAFDVTA
jgi:hypothetical protein